MLVLFACAAVTPVNADPSGSFLNRFWQTGEGMPSNVVSGIARDARGFLWIGTGAGVARFDGLRFELHSIDEGLPDTQIHSLYIDRAGRIWAGTRSGAAYREDGRWHIPAGLPAEAVFSIGEGQDGSIWLGTYRGCWRWSKGVASRIDLGDIAADTRAFLDDGYGGLWILTSGHLCRWYPDKPGAARSVPGPWDGHDLRDLARDSTGRVVICGTGFLMRESGGEWQDLAETMPDGTTSSNLACTASPDGVLWVATRDRGLMYLDDSGWTSINAGEGLISLDDVRTLLIGDDGLVWMGTNGGGLNLLRRQLFDSFSSSEGLGHTVTSSLVIDQSGGVWVGTDGGGVFKYQDKRFDPAPGSPPLPEDVSIWSLCTTRDGSLWIGTYRHGLLRVRNGACERIPLGDSTETNSISSLFETHDGHLLIGTHGEGVWSWNGSIVEPLLGGGPDGKELKVHDILEDREGNVWAACGSNGLWRRTSESWARVGEEPGKDVLNPGALLEGAGGELWIGTLGQGLFRYGSGRLDRWTKDNGLVSNIIVQMLEDDRRDLWLGTDAGLQRFSHEELEKGPGGRFTGIHLSRDDGLPTPQFSGEHGNLCARATDGTLWFSLASGAIHLDPRKFSKPRRAPEAWIESAAIDRGIIWETEGPLHGDRIIVAPGSGTLKIRLASPEFIAPERVRFRYRMTGLENEWQEIDGARVASYASLPPDNYRFELMVAGRDGVWSPPRASIRVEARPYLWQTLAFRIVTGSAILGLLGFALRAWTLRRIRKRMALLLQEQRVERERARIASDLHDDLGASLTEVNFLGTLAAAAAPEGPLRQRMSGIVERVQRMAKSLDEIVWTVNPANDTLRSTANYLSSRTVESLGAAGIRCRLSVDDSLPKMVLDSDIRHQLLLAVNEAVNNVMKHSGSPECHLRVSFENGLLTVVVEDFGRGFDPTGDAGTRNGLSNFRRRMESAGGSCTIHSSPGAGTTVQLTIPLAHSAS